MTKALRYKKICDDLQLKIFNSYKNKKMKIYSYIRLGLLAKYDKSIKAIFCLDNKGFFEDANIILRTVFEIFITIVFCELNPDENYKRFFDYNVITRLKYLTDDEEILNIFRYIDNKTIKEMELKKQQFKEIYHVKKISSWSDKNVKQICEELDKKYDTSFYTNMYTIVYRQNSEFIHPDIVNIFENYINIENKKINLNASAHADESFNDIIEILEKCNNKLLNIEFL